MREPTDSFPDHAELVGRMAAGDTQALRELYRRLSPLVHALACQITGTEQDGEEVLVDTFHQAWSQASRYDPSRASVTGWLVNIARSRGLDLLRTRRRWQRRKEAAAEPGAAFPHPPASDPETEAMHGEWRARLAEAVRALPPDQKRAVELAYFEGLTQQEISDRLGQPLGTVKTRIRLAMEKIRGAVSSVEESKP